MYTKVSDNFEYMTKKNYFCMLNYKRVFSVFFY